MIECAYLKQCHVQQCKQCVYDWEYVLYGLQHVMGTHMQHPPADPSHVCRHRRSMRKCCSELYLCGKFPGESCTPGISYTPGLRSCQTCELFEANE